MASDYFLKLDGIKGESADSKHKDEIDVESYSWGESRIDDKGDKKALSVSDFNFVMRMNRASAQLAEACNAGKQIQSGYFTARKAGEQQVEFLKLTFTDILISSYQSAGSGGSAEGPMDAASLSFGSMKIEYKMQDASGKVVPGSDAFIKGE